VEGGPWRAPPAHGGTSWLSRVRRPSARAAARTNAELREGAGHACARINGLGAPGSALSLGIGSAKALPGRVISPCQGTRTGYCSLRSPWQAPTRHSGAELAAAQVQLPRCQLSRHKQMRRSAHGRSPTGPCPLTAGGIALLSTGALARAVIRCERALGLRMGGGDGWRAGEGGREGRRAERAMSKHRLLAWQHADGLRRAGSCANPRGPAGRPWLRVG